MYVVSICYSEGDMLSCDADSLSDAIVFANSKACKGDKVQIFEVLDGLCGPEVQELILEYIEDGWQSYDN